MSGHGDSLQEKMAVVSFVWLSVVVKRGATTLVPRKIVKVGWESNFGELLGKVDQELEKKVAFKMSISKNEEFLETVHAVEITAPSLCNTLGCLFVYFYLDAPTSAAAIAGKFLCTLLAVGFIY